MKQPGLCTLCEKEVFEVLRRDPQTRTIREVGAPKPEAVRATLVLTLSGHTASVTFCTDCELTAQTMPLVWKKVMEAAVHEALGQHQNLLCLQNVDVPLGVICSQPWQEVMDG